MKSVKKLVERNEASLQPILSEMKQTKLVHVLLEMLKLGVFESESRAQA